MEVQKKKRDEVPDGYLSLSGNLRKMDIALLLFFIQQASDTEGHGKRLEDWGITFSASSPSSQNDMCIIDGKVAYTDWTCDQKHCEVGNSTLHVRHNHLCKNQKVKGSGSPK